MNNTKVLIDETDDATLKESIIQGIKEYNMPYLGVWEDEPFTLYIKDVGDKVIAGLFGKWYKTISRLEIAYFWVDKNHRHKKFGSRLIEAAEDFGRKKGVQCISLYTLDFQAPDFYKKLGFECVGIVPKWANGHDAHFMRKAL